MGEIVGAAIVSHAPGIMLPEPVRRSLNGGEDTSLVPGLRRLRTEVLDRLKADTFVVFDTHWIVTFEHILTAHARRHGRFTSHELPRGMKDIAYDMPGDPELAFAVERLAKSRNDTWALACDDPLLPIFYGTVNLWTYLDGGERWVSVGVNQTCEADDFLLLGKLIAEAIAGLADRRVVLLASGGLSHRMVPFKALRHCESSSPEHIFSAEARAADEQVLAWLRAGEHRKVIDFAPEYQKHAPEGKFGHYLMMVGALGGDACKARGIPFSAYENSVGTGQAHVWFERPEGGSWSIPQEIHSESRATVRP
ncbi:hypothetical protein [Pendulispora albinea]|uniref:Extradiol ring-cleavage dioxygenase class III enzyme subunit B domain-containing protein n=1 Tax=Pendulispora albinea TaxID=2741071 RepID=A0ABZ2LUI2_9BACT